MSSKTNSLPLVIINAALTLLFIYSTYQLSSAISSISTGTSSEPLALQLSALVSTSYIDFILWVVSMFLLYWGRICHMGFNNAIYNQSYTPALLNAGFIIVGIYTSVTSAAILVWISPDSNVTLANSKYNFEAFLTLSFVLIHCQVKHFKALKAEAVRAEQDNAVRDKTHNDNIEKSERELKLRIGQLADVIRLAPPNNFAAELSNYSDILEDWSTNHMLTLTLSLDEYSSCIEYEDAIEVQRTYIRASLMAITKLAGIYDNAELNESSKDCYRSNLALSLKKRNITEVLLYDKGKKRRSNEKYRLKINSEPNFRLFIDSRYSVCVNNSDTSILSNENDHQPKEFAEDNDIKNISLPVYLTDDINIYNVIGAPRALATCQAQFITDTIEAVENWENQGAPKPLIEEAKEYFKKDKKGQSIISMPLASNRYRRNHLKPNNMTGTVNIYRNTTGMFNNDMDKFNNFVHLVNPMLVSLSRMTDFHVLTLENYERLHYNQLKQRSS